MLFSVDMLWIVCPLALLAGFVDSVAGGGGLISLPAYYLAGLPPILAAGTNKLAAAMGTTLATANYARAGQIDMSIGGMAALGSFVCSALGALVLKQLPPEVARWLVMACIPVAAVFTLRGKKPQKTLNREWSPGMKRMLAFCIGCAVGFYDGLVGPGTGTFLILLFMYIFGLEAVMASGTAKVANLASNVAALISLVITGDVMVALGLPAGLCAMVGAFFGSKLTIRKGSKVVRGMMLVVLAMLLAKMLIDMIG